MNEGKDSQKMWFDDGRTAKRNTTEFQTDGCLGHIRSSWFCCWGGSLLERTSESRWNTNEGETTVRYLERAADILGVQVCVCVVCVMCRANEDKGNRDNACHVTLQSAATLISCKIPCQIRDRNIKKKCSKSQFDQLIRSNCFVSKILAISRGKNGCINICLLFSICAALASIGFF